MYARYGIFRTVAYFTNMTFDLETIGINPSDIASVNFSGRAGRVYSPGTAYFIQPGMYYQTITINLGSYSWSTTASELDEQVGDFQMRAAHIAVAIILKSGEQIEFDVTDQFSRSQFAMEQIINYRKILDHETYWCETDDQRAAYITEFSFPSSSPLILFPRILDLETNFNFQIGGYTQNVSQPFGREPFYCGLQLYYLDAGERLIVNGPFLDRRVVKTYWGFNTPPPDMMEFSPRIQTDGFIEKKTLNSGTPIRTQFIVQSPY